MECPLSMALRSLKCFSPFWDSCVYSKDQIRCKISKATSDFINRTREQEEMQFQLLPIPTSGVDANSSRVSLWFVTPGNESQLGSGVGMDLTCTFGISSACRAQASWSIFGGDTAEVPSIHGSSCQEAAMPYVPEDEEPPGEPQASQSPASQVSGPSLPAASLAGAKPTSLGWDHSAQPGQRVSQSPCRLQCTPGEGVQRLHGGIKTQYFFELPEAPTNRDGGSS